MAQGTSSSSSEEIPPLNVLLILKEESGVDLFSFSDKDMRDRLLTGLLLRDKKENTEKQFFWMDEKSNLNCFMLLPKSLTISPENGQVPSYVSEEETPYHGPERSKLDPIKLLRVKYQSVYQLKVGGKFSTMGLSRMRSDYEVVLYLKLTDKGGRKRIYAATTRTLSLPDGSLARKPWELVGTVSTDTWHPFQVGTFNMNANNVGELSFDIQVAFYGRPDILIKGVAIQPSAK